MTKTAITTTLVSSPGVALQRATSRWVEACAHVEDRRVVVRFDTPPADCGQGQRQGHDEALAADKVENVAHAIERVSTR